MVRNIATVSYRTKLTFWNSGLLKFVSWSSGKKNLQKRMELIAQLQSSRNLGPTLMDEIATVVPAGVYLTNLQKQGPSLLSVGKSESNNRLSAMIRSVESSNLLGQPLLEFIEAGKDQTPTAQ